MSFRIAFNIGISGEARLSPMPSRTVKWHGLRYWEANAQTGGTRRAVSDHNSKRIVRQWNREIADEDRREAERQAAPQPWRALVLGALWVFWLLLLVLIGHIKSL